MARAWQRWADHHGLDGAHACRISHGRQSHDTMAEPAVTTTPEGAVRISGGKTVGTV